MFNFSGICAWILLLFNCLWPHGLQHTRLFNPPLLSKICSNSLSVTQWCYLIILSSAAPFSFCLQFFLASGSFPLSWLFASGGQSIGASTSASVLPMNSQGWFPLGWTLLISSQSKGLLIVFTSTTCKSINSLLLSLLYDPTHICI